MEEGGEDPLTMSQLAHLFPGCTRGGDKADSMRGADHPVSSTGAIEKGGKAGLVSRDDG